MSKWSTAMPLRAAGSGMLTTLLRFQTSVFILMCCEYLRNNISYLRSDVETGTTGSCEDNQGGLRLGEAGWRNYRRDRPQHDFPAKKGPSGGSPRRRTITERRQAAAAAPPCDEDVAERLFNRQKTPRSFLLFAEATAWRGLSLEQMKHRNRVVAARALGLDLPRDEASHDFLDLASYHVESPRALVPAQHTSRIRIPGSRSDAITSTSVSTLKRDDVEHGDLEDGPTAADYAHFPKGGDSDFAVFFEEHESWDHEDENPNEAFFFDHDWKFCRDDRAHRQRLHSVKDFLEMDDDVKKLNEAELKHRKDGCMMEGLFTPPEKQGPKLSRCFLGSGKLHPSALVNGRTRKSMVGDGRQNEKNEAALQKRERDVDRGREMELEEERVEGSKDQPKKPARTSEGLAEAVGNEESARNKTDRNSKDKVLLIILDMLSFREVLRSLPKSMLYLSQKLNATVFDNFNVVGPNSPLNQYPMAHGLPFPARPGANITGQKLWRDRDVWTDKKRHILSLAHQNGFRTFAGCDCSLHTRFQKCYCMSYWMHFAELRSQYAARTWSPVKGWCSTGHATQVVSPAYNATLANGTAVRLRSFKRWGHGLGVEAEAGSFPLPTTSSAKGSGKGGVESTSTSSLPLPSSSGISSGMSPSTARFTNGKKTLTRGGSSEGSSTNANTMFVLESPHSSTSLARKTSTKIDARHVWSDQEKEGEQLLSLLERGEWPEGVECRSSNGYSLCYDKATSEQVLHLAPTETGAGYYFGGGQEKVHRSLGNEIGSEKVAATSMSSGKTSQPRQPSDDRPPIAKSNIALEAEGQVSRLLFEDMLDFFDVFHDEKAFGVAFFDEGHTMLHPKYRPGAPVVNNVDTFFRDFLRELYLRHPNTNLVLCSDHGRIPPVTPFVELAAFHHRNPVLVTKLAQTELGRKLEDELVARSAQGHLSPHHIYDILHPLVTGKASEPRKDEFETSTQETGTLSPVPRTDNVEGVVEDHLEGEIQAADEHSAFLQGANIPSEWSLQSILHFEWPPAMKKSFCDVVKERIKYYRLGFHAFKMRQIQIGDMPPSALKRMDDNEKVENPEEICDLDFTSEPDNKYCQVLQSSSALVRPAETRDKKSRKVIDSATVNVIVEFTVPVGAGPADTPGGRASNGTVVVMGTKATAPTTSSRASASPGVRKFQYSAVIMLDSGRVDIRHLAEVTVYGHYSQCILKYMDEATMKRKGMHPQWCKCKMAEDPGLSVAPGFL
ncbi:unnamed protein product [Amoebophrya sp. A25]|nr:unnamed protein product [Amoebophrya sp. A25]|eukprot:GSA25T00010823001.1